MKLGDVALVARKELRETLRDRRTLVVMIMFPLVVYPLVSLLMAQVMATHTARGEAHLSRVAVVGPPALAAHEVAQEARGEHVEAHGRLVEDEHGRIV